MRLYPSRRDLPPQAKHSDYRSTFLVFVKAVLLQRFVPLDRTAVYRLCRFQRAVSMSSSFLLLPILFALLACKTPSEQQEQPTKAAPEVQASGNQTVVVFGATPGGIIAAIAAKRSGREVILLEASNELGGVVVGGLGASDTCNVAGIGSTAREFFTRVGTHYGLPVRWFVEPKVAKKVFYEMLADVGLEVAFNKRLASVEKNGNRIISLRTEDGAQYPGRVFIDASYEGDLLAAAGVDYIVGREGRSQYGESMAGATDPHPARNFRVPVSAYAEDGTLLPGIQSEKLPEVGSADKKVMAANFRFCLSRVPENRAEIPAPEHYDPMQFELLARYLQALPSLELHDLIKAHTIAAGKLCTNREGPFSTNFVGESWTWPEASYQEREKIFKAHKEYTLGFLHFLNTDPRVPKHIQDTMNLFGFCKDEFVETDNFPAVLYIREGRRMIGSYVLRESDLIDNRFKEDGIGLASCPIEVHSVQRAVREDKTVVNEGVVGFRVKPYAIPYRSVTPKQAQADNLLVPVAVSASQIAYSSMRMEPVFMILGHSVGVAASMAIEADTAVQEIDVQALRERLRQHKQVL